MLKPGRRRQEIRGGAVGGAVGGENGRRKELKGMVRGGGGEEEVEKGDIVVEGEEGKARRSVCQEGGLKEEGVLWQDGRVWGGRKGYVGEKERERERMEVEGSSESERDGGG